MHQTGIEYVTHAWNPIAMRCTRVDAGGKNCWHLRACPRVAGQRTAPSWEQLVLLGEARPVLRERELRALRRRKKPAVIAVQFMGDLFHHDVPAHCRRSVFARGIARTPQHGYLILSKRVEEMAHFAKTTGYAALENVYWGTSVSDQKTADERIPELLKIEGKRWLSIEPMLGPVWLRDPVDGVVIGPEKGPKPRPCKDDWIRRVNRQCLLAGIPFFDKRKKWIRRETPWALNKSD